MSPECELAFAAGLMEGEGTVRISTVGQRNKGILVVSMVNTDISLVEFMHERWPGYCKPATGMRANQRPAWVWTIAARKALAFVDQIEPFVVSPRMRERIALARWWQEIKAKHWKLRVEDDAEQAFCCYMRMREINRRGVAA